MKKILLTSVLAAASMLTCVPAVAAPVTFLAMLTGAAEAPPNASPATGNGTVVFDTVAHTMTVDFSYAGLLGTLSAAHLHCCTALAGTGTAGVATPTPSFPGLASGSTTGSYFNLFDMSLVSSFNAAFVTANGGTAASAETALFNAMSSGKTYLNLHSSTFGGGEIRGFLVQAVPEPASLALTLTALAGLGLLRRRR